MFQRHALIALVLFIAGCATASEPPVQQSVVPEPAQAVLTEPVPAELPPVVVEKPAASVSPERKQVPDSRLSESVATPRITPKATSGPDDTAIIRYVLAQSRASYSGNCACPDDRDRAGRRCGGRSAYSRPGGYSPLCYPRDVTPEMIEKARREMRL